FPPALPTLARVRLQRLSPIGNRRNPPPRAENAANFFRSSAWTARGKVYCARGRMENLIKDMKLYTRSDRTSCHRWEANQFRLFLHMGAYWLLHELRGATPKRSIWRTATFETIRCTFLKIAVRIQELKTRIKMALPSSYPHVQA